MAGCCWLGGGLEDATARARAAAQPARNLYGPRCTRPAPPATPSGAGTCALPDPPAVEERVAVWVTLDPRSGALSAYPSDIAKQIESCFSSGVNRVSLRGFGGFYERSVIALRGTRTGRPEQQSKSGARRDVRRVELSGSARKVRLHVFQEAGWHVADEPVPGRTQEKQLELLGFEKTPALASGGIRIGEHHDAGAAAREEAVAAGDAMGHVALWEWCRAARAEMLSSLPAEMWGVYVEAQNDAIEAAFRAGKSSIQIVIGIRTFEIIFEGPDRARQVDHALRKGRHVRRRLLLAAERDQVFEAATRGRPDEPARDEQGEECAICCCEFSETPTLQSVCLPECGHTFHRACIQNSADRKEPCPLCRADINWSGALASSLEEHRSSNGG